MRMYLQYTTNPGDRTFPIELMIVGNPESQVRILTQNMMVAPAVQLSGMARQAMSDMSPKLTQSSLPSVYTPLFT